MSAYQKPARNGFFGLVLDKTMPVTTPAGGELLALWGQHLVLVGKTGATVLKNGKAFPVPDLPDKTLDGTSEIPKVRGAAFSTDGHLVLTTEYGLSLLAVLTGATAGSGTAATVLFPGCLGPPHWRW